MIAPSTRRLALAAAFLLAGCARASQTRSPDPGEPPPPPAPLPRSSVAAVLAHRGELALTEAQTRALEEADAALEREKGELLRAAGAPDRRGPDRRGEGSPGGPGKDAAPGGGGPGPGGSGPPPGGGRGMGGERGAKGPDAGAAAAALMERLDDADTRAWLRAEERLAPAQRERAREIAADYRAARYEQRAAAPSRGRR